MMFFYHPGFQSFVLPLTLFLVLAWGLRTASLAWRLMTPPFALLLALAVWPGFVWPALAHAQMLPWWVLGSTVLALLARLFPVNTVWTGYQGVRLVALLPLSGLMLAAWAALGGSLLLAQLAAVLTSVGAAALVQAWRLRAASWLALLPLLVLAATLAMALSALPTRDSALTGDDDPYYTTE
jgi:hypothetical protein